MKGGYKIKEGFYIKDDCKNSEEEGMIDEDGFILDPVTFEKIPERKLIQLSDGYCYDKRNSKQLLTVINRSNRLPFGHDIASDDRRQLRALKPKKRLLIVESTPSIPSSSTPVIIEEPVIIESPTEFEITPQRRRTRRIRTRRTRPTLIIESETPELSSISIPSSSITVPSEESDPFGEVDSNVSISEIEERLGRGTKRKTKKHKSKKSKKTKRKTRKYHK
jgi:hypothetical protein